MVQKPMAGKYRSLKIMVIVCVHLLHSLPLSYRLADEGSPSPDNRGSAQGRPSRPGSSIAGGSHYSASLADRSSLSPSLPSDLTQPLYDALWSQTHSSKALDIGEQAVVPRAVRDFSLV